MNKQRLLDNLIQYEDNMTEFDIDEMQYLISLVRSEIMMDEFMKLHPVNLNR
jgi:hypothetical protein